jgi:gas vesicle protein
MKNNIKETLNEKAFNRDIMLTHLYQRAHEEGLRNQWTKDSRIPTAYLKSVLFGSLSIIMMTSIMILNPIGPTTDPSKVVAAFISIDINPSFELSVNGQGIVLSVKSINPDAYMINTSTLIGEDISDAVEQIVQMACDEKYIDLSDLIEDYVVITTLLKDPSETFISDLIKNRINKKIAHSSTLQEVNIVEINSSQNDKDISEGKNISFGLYVLNKLKMTPSETIMSVEEFFSNKINEEELEQLGGIIEIDPDKIRERIDTALINLQDHGSDVSDIWEQLNSATDEDLQEIEKEIQDMQEDISNQEEPERDNIDESNPSDPIDQETNQSTDPITEEREPLDTQDE